MQPLDAIATAMKDADGVSSVVRKEKSVRVTIDGETYDLFCRKVPTTDFCGELRNAFGEMFKRRKSRKSDKIVRVVRTKLFIYNFLGGRNSMYVGSPSGDPAEIRPALLLERATFGLALVFHDENIEAYRFDNTGSHHQRSRAVADDPEWKLPLEDPNLIDNLETCLKSWGVSGLELP